MEPIINQYQRVQNLKLSFLKIASGMILVSIGLISCNQNKQAQQNEQAKQASVLDSSIGQKQLPIWTKFIPDSGLIKGIETVTQDTNSPVGGKPYTWVTNVSYPTITIYSPKVKNTGTAVIVFPGGGYQGLAISLEGSEICEWLTSIGVTGILLKYRVPNSGPHWDSTCNCHKDAEKPLALEDAQRTLGLVRFHAKEWNVNPDKIGVIGFSAGGHLVADISTHYKGRVYPIADAADKESCKPNFAIALYPGHILEHTTKEYQLNPSIPIDHNTPPTFLLQAGNDPVDTIQNSLVYYIALRKAGVPTEYHIYAEGKHAFGLRKTNLPITNWTQLVDTWLHTINMVSK
jgi:acetyl esterase/lipase